MLQKCSKKSLKVVECVKSVKSFKSVKGVKSVRVDEVLKLFWVSDLIKVAKIDINALNKIAATESFYKKNKLTIFHFQDQKENTSNH